MKKGVAINVMLAVTALIVAGCAHSGRTRNFSQVGYRPTEHFRVQFLLPEGDLEKPVPIEQLLLLPPFGLASEAQSRMFYLSIWQELQQVLPGIVRSPRDDGPFGQYTTAGNLIMDDGRINEEELERIGRLAAASHLLVVRFVDYRPYHPQRVIMEWMLLDVKSRSTVLVVSGSLDAAERQVVNAVDYYIRSRRPVSQTSPDLDVTLRSPRQYSAFVAAASVDALKGWVRPKSDVVIPYLSF